MKGVLFISYDGLTDPLGQSQVIPYLAGLSKLGYTITILSCEKPEAYSKQNELIGGLLKRNNITWHPIFYHKRPPILSTLYDIWILNRKAKALHKKNNFLLIHCRSYIAALIGLSFKKKKNIPFVFDMRGFYADERVDGKLWRLENPIYKRIYNFFKNKEKDFIRYSDAVVSLTNAGKSIIQKWDVWKKYKTPIEVIPCSADFTHFRIFNSEEKKLQRSKFKIDENSFVLSYLGSIGTWYMLDEMLDFFKVLLQKKPDAVFLILTSESSEKILEKASERDIPHDKFRITFSNRSELALKMSVSDLSIFFIKPCFSKLASSPTKLGELLAMGIPVVCNDGVGDVAEIVKSSEGGYVISAFNLENYQNVICELDHLNNFDSENMRIKSKEYYDLESAVNKYAGIYKSILG